MVINLTVCIDRAHGCTLNREDFGEVSDQNFVDLKLKAVLPTEKVKNAVNFKKFVVYS